MRYYPLLLDLTDRPCLVIGGGPVGTRKAGTLVRYGARVKVVSPEATPRIKEMADSGSLVFKARPYEQTDLDGVFLVFCATGDRPLNLDIKAQAEKRGILCNMADLPETSDFILPSVVSRGDLTLAISTGGKSPALAKKLRKDLSEQFGDEYAVFLDLMGKVRRFLLEDGKDAGSHKRVFDQLIHGDLLDLVRDNRTDAAMDLLAETLGREFVSNHFGNDKEQR